MLIKISNGALHADNAFLIRNRRGDLIMSANDPNANVAVASVRPMMVRYWKCQPYEVFLRLPSVSVVGGVGVEID